MGPPEPFGPPTPPPPEQFGPEPARVKPVVLVFGPGMARGYAFAGALRALSDARIPIGAVLGTEMGSLMASLYAVNPKINQFEWALKRFKGEIFSEKKGFISRVLQAGREQQPIDRELARAFGETELQQAQVPLRIGLELKNSGLPVVAERGKIALAVRAALAIPGIFDEGQWEGVPAVSAGTSRPYLVDEARALNLGPVIVIDARVENAESEAKAADLVIRPDLNGIATTDFDKLTEISWRGKSAVTGKISEIRKLTGLSGPREGGGASP